MVLLENEFCSFGGKIRGCGFLHENMFLRFFQENVFLRFWWKKYFFFVILAGKCGFANGGKMHFNGFGGIIHFCGFSGKVHFAVLAENAF